jgi:hypothetical protein
VTDALKALLKKGRVPAVIGTGAPNHRPATGRDRCSEPQVLGAILHWFASLPGALQEDFVAFYREEESVRKPSLAADAA